MYSSFKHLLANNKRKWELVSVGRALATYSLRCTFGLVCVTNLLRHDSIVTIIPSYLQVENGFRIYDFKDGLYLSLYIL